MFTVSPDDIQAVLAAFGIRERVLSAGELLRYRYERYDPDTKEVRLILKLCFSHAAPLVIKFKNEAGVTQTLMSQQISFSEHLADRGIPTARFHRAKDAFVVPKTLNGYDVLITVERYRPGEIKSVNPAVAQQIGRLLAAAHNIAEADDCHVNGAVLFDPFKENDLFSFERFEKTAAAFTGGDASRFLQICETCRARMNVLSPLREKKRYAVQGDLSNNNLFRTEHGEIGMFDFNRCGDNVLFCDALMQGVLIARLMDYDQGLTGDVMRVPRRLSRRKAFFRV